MTSRLSWCATLAAVFSLGTITAVVNLGTTACGTGSSSSGGSVCQSGATQACLCPSGGSGVQTCKDNGEGWQPCLNCGGSSSSSSGAVLPPLCTAGATQSCLCGGGVTGVQTCKVDGTGWLACGGCSGSSSSSSSSSGDAPQAGDPCPPQGGGYCVSTTSALLCDRNRLELFQCRGPYGCSPGNGCDRSKAAPGDACQTTWEGAGACSSVDQHVMVQCVRGIWTYYMSCGAQWCVYSPTSIECQ